MALAHRGNEARVIYHDVFDGKGFTNENSLANALLTKSDQINPVITHLQGREDYKFPLTHLTEGQVGGSRTVDVNDVQYEWDTIEKIRRADPVLSTTYVAGNKPGINNTEFIVVFETNWLKQQHLVFSPNGIQARISGRPRALGTGFEYRLRLVNPDPNAFIDPVTELAPGAKWSMTGGAPVAPPL